MNKRLLFFTFSIIIIVSLFLSSAFSQTESEIPLSISAGVSMPVNEFASTNGSDAGFAKLGYSISVEHSLLINGSSRLLTTLSLSSNMVDEKALCDYTIQQIAPVIGGDPQIQQQFIQLFKNNTLVDESGSYYSILLMTGPEMRTQLSSDMNVSVSLQAGLLVQTSPAYKVVYSRPGELGLIGQGFINQSQKTETAYAVGMSAGMELAGWKLRVKYIWGQPSYNISRSYMLPPLVMINSNSIDIPLSEQFGSFQVGKNSFSVITLEIGFVLRK